MASQGFVSAGAPQSGIVGALRALHPYLIVEQSTVELKQAL
jgi:hypothetical protein